MQKNSEEKKFKLAGFFAGVGGIELAFAKAGFDVIWANEQDPKAAMTYRANHSSELVLEDINKIDPSTVPDVDIIVAGFPCQAFSIAGYRKGFEDERGEVFFRLARVIREKRPRVIFMENVKNLLSHDGGNTYRVIKETLESFGYRLWAKVLNSADYGNLPQNRERIYIIGFLEKEDFLNYKEISPLPLKRKITDIIDNQLKVEDKYYYTKDNCSFFDKIEIAKLSPDTFYQWRRVYLRENKSKLCPTLTANMGTGGHNVPLLLTKHGLRKLRPKECFDLQGFPSDFILPQDLANCHLYKQAGNSVALPVVKRLALSIKNSLLTV